MKTDEYKKEYFKEIALSSRDDIVEEAYHYFLLYEQLKEKLKILNEEKLK